MAIVVNVVPNQPLLTPPLPSNISIKLIYIHNIHNQPTPSSTSFCSLIKQASIELLLLLSFGCWLPVGVVVDVIIIIIITCLLLWLPLRKVCAFVFSSDDDYVTLVVPVIGAVIIIIIIINGALPLLTRAGSWPSDIIRNIYAICVVLLIDSIVPKQTHTYESHALMAPFGSSLCVLSSLKVS